MAETRMRRLVNAMQGLADSVNSQTSQIKIGPFIEACLLFNVEMFGCGAGFHFVNLEIVDQVRNVQKRASANETLRSAVERDIANGTAKGYTSLSRALYRLKRMIELAMVSVERIITKQGSESLADSIEAGYIQVFAQYHGPIIRNLFFVVKATIPTMPIFLTALSEDENSVMEPFNKYIAAAAIVISHIEAIFQSDPLTAKLTRRV